MKKVLLVLLFVAVLGGGWYWLERREPEADEPETKPAARVEVAPLRREAIARTIEAFGVVGSAPSSEAAISAPFDCLVRAVHVSAGARVTAGDLLLEIEPTPETKLELASARSLLALAESTLAATRQRLDLKLAANQDLLTAKQAADDARMKVASLEGRGLGGDGRITASVTGVVSKLDVSAGAIAPAGTVLVTVAAADRLEARLAVETGELGQIESGAALTLVSVSRPDVAPAASTVRDAGGTIDPATGAAEIRAAVPAGSPLYFGERVKAGIVVEQDEGLVAPRSAVLPDDDKQVLFTVKNGHAVRHEVKVGIVAGDLVEVSGADLHEGDPVVTLGNYELEDGMAIQAGAKDDDKKGAKEGDDEAAPAKEPKP